MSWLIEDYYYHFYCYTHLMASFPQTTWVSQYLKGKTSLDLNEAREDGVLGCSGIDHIQTICTSFQTDNHTNTSSPNFYTQDALPDTQPAA